MSSDKLDMFESFWDELGDEWIGLSSKEVAQLAWFASWQEAEERQRAKSMIDPYAR